MDEKSNIHVEKRESEVEKNDRERSNRKNKNDFKRSHRR